MGNLLNFTSCTATGDPGGDCRGDFLDFVLGKRGKDPETNNGMGSPLYYQLISKR